MTALEVRKVVAFREDTLIEGGKAAERPLRMVAVAAVLANPWAGGFVADLRSGILAIAPALGDLLVPQLVAEMGGADAIEAFGKAAVVGTEGEIEHGAGLIHTLRFGNAVREAVDGNSFMPFTNKRGAPGCLIAVPLVHKREERKGARSHFLTHELAIPDAPGPREIVVAIAAASGGRPHHRIGDRFQDMKEMGVDQAGRSL